MSKKVIAYCPLHYGAEYLVAAIRSVAPYVDKIMILYSRTPSYGFGTNEKCPETEDELYFLAVGASEKVEWVSLTNVGSEGHHRNIILNYSQGYDGILAFDADEVFDYGLEQTIQDAFANGNRYIGFDGYINFWKSFNHVCYDGFLPIRFINLAAQGGTGSVKARVYHFSTAQKMETMKYKLQIHGHKDEIRPGWLDEIYAAWTAEQNQQDLHLVALGLWNAVPFDKTTMPQILKDHPNYNKETI